MPVPAADHPVSDGLCGCRKEWKMDVWLEQEI